MKVNVQETILKWSSLITHFYSHILSLSLSSFAFIFCEIQFQLQTSLFSSTNLSSQMRFFSCYHDQGLLCSTYFTQDSKMLPCMHCDSLSCTFFQFGVMFIKGKTVIQRLSYTASKHHYYICWVLRRKHYKKIASMNYENYI